MPKLTVNQAPTIPAHALALAAAAHGGMICGTLAPTATPTAKYAEVDVVVTAAGIGFALIHDMPAAEPPRSATWVHLKRLATARRGAFKWLWLCPVTARWCTALYRIDGVWASRPGHKLAYQSQRRVHPRREIDRFGWRHGITPRNGRLSNVVAGTSWLPARATDLAKWAV